MKRIYVNSTRTTQPCGELLPPAGPAADPGEGKKGGKKGAGKRGKAGGDAGEGGADVGGAAEVLQLRQVCSLCLSL